MKHGGRKNSLSGAREALRSLKSALPAPLDHIFFATALGSAPAAVEATVRKLPSHSDPSVGRAGSAHSKCALAARPDSKIFSAALSSAPAAAVVVVAVVAAVVVTGGCACGRGGWDLAVAVVVVVVVVSRRR